MIAGLSAVKEPASLAQVQNLQAATNAASLNALSVPLEHIVKLLALLCHPEPSQRATAAAVASTAWLRAAAAMPLPKRPFCL